MKRHGHLFEELCSFENLYRAAGKARRGKRARRDVERFEFNLESNLVELSEALRDRDVPPWPVSQLYDHRSQASIDQCGALPGPHCPPCPL